MASESHIVKKKLARPFDHVWKIIDLFSPREKRNLALVFLGAVFMAIIEVIGIGSIMPFMAVASQPSMVESNEYLSWAYELLGFENTTSFLVFLGIAMIAFLLFSNFVTALMHYVKIRFTSMRRHSLSTTLMKSYLGQPYPYFLNKDSHGFIKNINSEIEHVITGSLMRFVDLVTKVIQVLLITGFLFFVNPVSTLGVSVSILLLYGIVYSFTRGPLKRLGKQRYELNSQRARIVSETFWGIKEVKVMGLEQAFLQEYTGPSKQIAREKTNHEIIGDIPKFALEAVAFSSILVFVLISIVHGGGFSEAATDIGLFAYAGYRLIPAIQGLFKSLTKVRYGSATAERIMEEFAQVAEAEPLAKKPATPMPITQELRLEDIYYTYPSSDQAVLKGISLDIPVRQSIGLAGKTGSGKTTLVDLILGLHRQQSGQILVDGLALDSSNLRNWQANLGYVPQFIYLSNSSVAQNIAFGVPPSKIDMDAVRLAAHMAQIDDFIETELPMGYDTRIGERGVRLSGGQRQRVGIARALYRNPDVLILDEATSALDRHTEDAVMNAIESLSGQKTIIIIAHRLSTLKSCHQIYLIEAGGITDAGTYEELTERNPYFAK